MCIKIVIYTGIYKLSNKAWKVLIVINIKNHLSFGVGQTNQVQTKENM